MSEQEIFRIPEGNFATLTEKLEKLSRKAVKLGLEPLQLEQEGTEDVPLVSVFDDVNGGGWTYREDPRAKPADIKGYRRYLLLRLIGTAPVLPGWSLVAVIEHGDSELGNVLRVAPGETCPTEYRQAQPLCQHCNMVRRRLETFVLRNAQGEVIQIGRNCLADFVRSPEAAAQLCGFAEMVASARGLCGGAEDDEFFGGGFRVTLRVPTEAMLAKTARVIRLAGWCSRGEARKAAEYGKNKEATADLVSRFYFDRQLQQLLGKPEYARLRELYAAPEAADISLADEALAWVRSWRANPEGLSDYEHSLLVVLSDESVEQKHFGIACSAIAAYSRHIQRELERSERSRKLDGAFSKESTHFGTVGERGRWPAIFLGRSAFEADGYGRNDTTVRYVYRFSVNGGDLAIWWTGSDYELALGERVYLVGTIKAHSAYKDKPQTVLTRCDVYGAADQGSCPNCAAVVLRCDAKKNCPSCKKRGLKVADSWFPEPEAQPCS